MLIVKDRPSTALRIDKKKQLTPLAVYVEMHIYNTKGERFYLFQILKWSVEVHLLWNKAKRFLNMSVAICNEPKIGIIRQKTFFVSCLFCKTIHFYGFEQNFLQLCSRRTSQNGQKLFWKDEEHFEKALDELVRSPWRTKQLALAHKLVSQVIKFHPHSETTLVLKH